MRRVGWRRARVSSDRRLLHRPADEQARDSCEGELTTPLDSSVMHSYVWCVAFSPSTTVKKNVFVDCF